MAVYNGEKYISDQIKSIIVQLRENDELVISYDDSSDKTLDIIKSFADSDSRIKLFPGPNKGVIANFENAIKRCMNECIFLSDQDDIWTEDKVKCVLKEFEDNKVDLVIHDARIVDENLNQVNESFFNLRKCKKGLIKNIVKNSYIGCCMAFKSSLKKYILPFPHNIPMHDQWIGLIAEHKGNVKFLDKKLILYRRHGNNLSSSSHSGVKQMIAWRYNIVKEYMRRCKGG